MSGGRRGRLTRDGSTKPVTTTVFLHPASGGWAALADGPGRPRGRC